MQPGSTGSQWDPERLEKQDRFRYTFEQAPLGLAHVDPSGRWLLVNQQFCNILGYSRDELLRIRFQDMTPAEDLLNLSQFEHLVAGKLDSYSREKRFIRPDDTHVWVNLTVSMCRDTGGAPTYILCVVEDITERKATEEALRRSEESFRLLFADHPHPMWVYDLQTLQFLEVNAAAIARYGYDREEFLSMRITDIRPPEDVEAVRAAAQTVCSERRGFSEWQHLSKDGRLIDVEIASSIVPFHGRDAALVLAEDITERKRAARTLEHQALHDALTGLPNRTLFNDRLNQAILAARRDTAPLALLLLDLDRFKEINDTFGHHFGDRLLQHVSRRIEHALRDSDTVARLGGDEFAVLLTQSDERAAIAVADKLLRALARRIEVDDQCIDVDGSVGIALFPHHGDDSHTLLRHADVAMYVAKRTHARRAVYRPEQDEHSATRLSLTGDLRRAIERDQLMLYYQPLANVQTGRVEHVEALARWQHPEHGWIGPDEFIPLAEQTGLIDSLSRWVLKVAIQQSKVWNDAGYCPRVAVNLSARNLHNLRLPHTIARLLRTHGAEPSWLVVEITESAVMADPFRALRTLTRLHELGVRIAIDDFGTGYSSLGYLRRLPVSEIKIDKSFVLDMLHDEGAEAIVRSTIHLGHDLGLHVVAEGVETHDVWQVLARMECDAVQGYVLNRPLPAEECGEWLRAQITRTQLPDRKTASR